MDKGLRYCLAKIPCSLLSSSKFHRKRIMKLSITILFFILSMAIFAHGDEKHNKDHKTKADTFTVVNGDTIAVNGIPVEAAKQKSVEAEKEEPFELNPAEQIFVHMHNKLVHFPIVIGIVAFLLTLANIKTKNYERVILVLIIAGILFTIGTVVTGLNQTEPFNGTGKQWLVEFHRNTGIALLASYICWFVFTSVQRLKKFSWIIGLLTISLITLAGFLGGVIAH